MGEGWRNYDWDAQQDRKHDKEQKRVRSYVVCESCSKWKCEGRLKKDLLCECGQMLGRGPGGAQQPGLAQQYSLDRMIESFSKSGHAFAPGEAEVVEASVAAAVAPPAPKDFANIFQLRLTALEWATKYTE
ncbi:unnamed protein product [Prorocentrum cordatum]|uniref:Uncharacterized protein n=1 Tax=Prorocentrum cordatum TaxID=2364126 RepID=A0ABN9UGX4_9DINO|nr:unnamed protein product [Polarella glacialis]